LERCRHYRYPKDAWHVIPQRRVENDDGGSTEDAEVIASSSDESMFRRLHGVTAKDADYDELAKSVRDDEYAGILDVVKEMAAQHPAAMWFVRSWSVDSAASD